MKPFGLSCLGKKRKSTHSRTHYQLAIMPKRIYTLLVAVKITCKFALHAKILVHQSSGYTPYYQSGNNLVHSVVTAPHENDELVGNMEYVNNDQLNDCYAD